jgi:hypothetical protein
MKTPLIALTLLVCAALARAQEAIEPETLQKVAGRLTERTSDQENLPLKIEIDSAKAVGMTVKEYGTVVLPAKGLTVDALAKAGSDILPVGYMWLKGLVPVADGKRLGDDKRRVVKVAMEKEEHILQLLTLGLRKNAEGKFELVVFAKDKDAVMTLPLKEEPNEQTLPVAVNMRQGTDSLGLIDLHIEGKLHAVMPVEQP